MMFDSSFKSSDSSRPLSERDWAKAFRKIDTKRYAARATILRLTVSAIALWMLSVPERISATVINNNPPFDENQLINTRLDSNGDQVPDWWRDLTGLGDGDLRLIDTDNDGISDAEEYYYSRNFMPQLPAELPWSTLRALLLNGAQLLDPLNSDSDGDGFLDGLEVKLGSNPFNIYVFPWDRDEDGISDEIEAEENTDPDDPESRPQDDDGDGYINKHEIQAETDPLDPLSYPKRTLFDLDFSNGFIGAQGEENHAGFAGDFPPPSIQSGFNGPGLEGGLYYQTYGNIYLPRMTVEFWFQPSHNYGDSVAFGKESWVTIFGLGSEALKRAPPCLRLSMHRQGKILRLAYADGSGEVNETISAAEWKRGFTVYPFKKGEWMHVGITYDYEEVILYLNGVESIRLEVDGTMLRYPDGMRLIAMDGQRIDEISIVNYLKTPTEILNDARVDQDGDGLYDYWEYRSFGNLTEASSPSGDPDGDTLNNLTEMTAGTDGGSVDSDLDLVQDDQDLLISDPLSPDSDADGLPDNLELNMGTDPMDADSDGDLLPDGLEVYAKSNPDSADTLTLLEEVNVQFPTREVGQWKWRPGLNRMRILQERGALEYEFTVTEKGMYFFRLQAHQTLGSYNRHQGAPENNANVHIFINDHLITKTSFNQALGFDNEEWVLGPMLKVGTHTMKIFVVGSPRMLTDFGVEALEVYQLEGVDADLNGIDDWSDDFLAEHYSVTAYSSDSWRNPALLEGEARFVNGAESNDFTVQAGLKQHWYGFLHLDATGSPVAFNLEFEAKQVSLVGEISWTPLNLLDASVPDSLYLRKGDQIRIFAEDAQQDTPPAEFDAVLDDGILQTANTAGYLEYEFPEAGMFTLEVTHGTGSRVVQLKVFDNPFAGDLYPVQAGEPRVWVNPIHEDGTELNLEFDRGVNIFEIQNSNEMEVYLEKPESHSVLARAGEQGIIIGKQKFEGFTLEYTNQEYLLVVDSIGDYDVVEANLFGMNFPETVFVELDVFVPDVTFLPSGESSQIVDASDFDELQVYTYQLLRPKTARYSSCHRTSLHDENDPDEEFGLVFVQMTNPAIRTADQDMDGDGMPDIWEMDYGFDPQDPTDAEMDQDDDDLTNLDEYKFQTDPNNADTDNDGIEDGVEIEWAKLLPFDPLDPSDGSADFDMDGLKNFEELFENTDPTNPDTDEDGMPDGWEVTYGLDPLDNGEYRDANNLKHGDGIHGPYGDLDSDGATNLFEYFQGTNPLNDSPAETPDNIESEIVLQNPVDGSIYLQRDTVQISATATDTDTSIDRVEFYLEYQGLLATVSSPSEGSTYTWVWENPLLNGAPISSYEISALGFDDQGNEIPSLPVVASYPLNENGTQDHSVLLLSVTVPDTVIVDRIEFYGNKPELISSVGALSVTEDVYSWLWQVFVDERSLNTVYPLSAVVYDIYGHKVVSNKVTVTVMSDVDNDRMADQDEQLIVDDFLNNPNSYGLTDQNLDGLVDIYDVIWNADYDRDGASNYYEFLEGTSSIDGSIVPVSNTPSQISFQQPMSGDLFWQGDDLLFKVTATDADTEISVVRFYVNGEFIGQDLITVDDEFGFIWNSVSIIGGADTNYTLQALVEDVFGNQVLSELVNITVWADEDSDRMRDSWELQIINEDALDGITSISEVMPTDDYDADGANNHYEFVAGTNPVDNLDQPVQMPLSSLVISEPAPATTFWQGEEINLVTELIASQTPVDQVEFYYEKNGEAILIGAGADLQDELQDQYSLIWIEPTLESNGSNDFLIYAKATDVFGHVAVSASIEFTIWADQDSDRMLDSWEQQIVDANPNDQIDDIHDVLPADDFDGDGASNLFEFFSETGPLDDQDAAAFVTSEISIHEPADGVVIWEWEGLELTALATNSDENIQMEKVEFLVDGLVMGTDSNADGDGFYRYRWSGVSMTPGTGTATHQLTAKVYDQHFNSVVSSVVMITALEDADKDRMRDDWERTYFGGQLDQKPEGDFDGDGATNRFEFVEGTNPVDPLSYPADAASTVSFLLPASGSIHWEGEAISIYVQANDTDSEIDRVEIYEAANFIGLVKKSSAEGVFEFIWPDAEAKSTGLTSYQLTARVIDEYGKAKDSAFLNVSIQGDEDGDRMGDDWEVLHFSGIQELPDADYDGDGVSNLHEYLLGFLPDTVDSDTDGIPDNLEDRDEDGMPDAWEISYSDWVDYEVEDEEEDPDDDGIINLMEYQKGLHPGVFDVDELDLDSDDMLDTWEQKIVDADLTDGIEKVEDVLATADFDGDGVNNLEEYKKGTDPTDPLNGYIDDPDGDGLGSEFERLQRTDILYRDHPAVVLEVEMPATDNQK